MAAPPRLLDLPRDVLEQIVTCALEDDLSNFWRLSRVSRGAKALAEDAVGKRRSLGGDASAKPLRARTTLAEPALPLGRLLRCASPFLQVLDLSGAHAWVRGDGVAAAEVISQAPFAPRLRVLRLDHCERLSNNAMLRLVAQREAAPGGGGSGEGGGDSKAWAPGPEPALPSLRELSLRSCSRLYFSSFLHYLRSLEHLDVAWVPRLGLGPGILNGGGWTEEGGILPGRDCVPPAPRLRYFDVSGNETVQDGLFAHLPEGLTELRLAATAVSDVGLAAIGERLPELKKLVLPKPAANLWASGTFSEGGLAELRRRRPQLAVELASV